MQRITDKQKISTYIRQYHLVSIFPEEILPYIQLFLFQKGDYICRTNEKLQYIYFFVEGRVKAFTILANGRSFLHTFYQDFEVIGDVEFSNGKNIYSDVQAISDTYCLGISMKYRTILSDNKQFMHFITLHLADKLMRSSQNDSINLYYPLENRLASYIIHTSENELFHENLTDVSDLLATSYRHLLRTLQKFCKEGILKHTNRGYQISAKHKLEILGKDVY